MKKRALVTGGAGFIGSHLCEMLLAKNYQVTALDNLFVGTKKNLADLMDNRNFRLVVGDVRDEKLVTILTKDVDIVYHLAAVVGVSVVVANPLETIDVNVSGTQVVARATFKYHKKIVFASSSEVYGKNSEVPLEEDTSESVIGSTKVTRWSYAHTKALGEHILFGYAEMGLEMAIVRYFNCYGPRGINSKYANVVPKFIDQALNNQPITVYGQGKDSRSFCYVTDTVLGTILAGEKLTNDVVNLGSSKEVKILDLAHLVKKMTGSKSAIKFIEENRVYNKKFESSPRRISNTKKASKLIGFRAKMNLTEGLTKTIKWTKSQL